MVVGILKKTLDLTIGHDDAGGLFSFDLTNSYGDSNVSFVEVRCRKSPCQMAVHGNTKTRLL